MVSVVGSESHQWMRVGTSARPEKSRVAKEMWSNVTVRKVVPGSGIIADEHPLKPKSTSESIPIYCLWKGKRRFWSCDLVLQEFGQGRNNSVRDSFIRDREILH
ncbi:hypothetical protein BT69DRAFT_1284866 [Atractiella rhizophila]|nr:hypothetical protein BT69DRAFT_1284866 [Atractiella rhizophila]